MMIRGVLMLVVILIPTCALSADPQPASESVERAIVSGFTRGIQTIAERHVTPVSQAKLAGWAIEGLFAEFNEAIPSEIEQRLARLESEERVDVEQLLQDVCTHLGSRKALNKQKTLEAGFGRIFQYLEPGARDQDRSSFTRRDFVCVMFLPNLAGIGLKIEPDQASGMLRVVTPIYKGSAYQAGLRAGDLITHIRIDTDKNGQPLDKPMEVSTKGMTVEEAFSHFLGKKGTHVTLRVIPAP